METEQKPNTVRKRKVVLADAPIVSVEEVLVNGEVSKEALLDALDEIKNERKVWKVGKGKLVEELPEGTFEKDTSEALPNGMVKVSSGAVIPLSKRCFLYRKGTLTDGREAELDIKGRIYAKDSTGALHNIAKDTSLTKSQKKALKKARTTGRVRAPQLEGQS